MSSKKSNRALSQKERAYEAYLAKFPDWYWVNSLHDARILSVQTDIAYVLENDRPFQNCLALEIDSRGCYEDDIRTIYLFNCNTDAEDIHILDASWWLHDILSGEEGDWQLRLTVDTADFVEKTLNIQFEFAIVR